jgi:hypothetical protein
MCLQGNELERLPDGIGTLKVRGGGGVQWVKMRRDWVALPCSSRL